MYRFSFCEIYTRKLLPSIKLYMAYRLVKDYGFTQLEASRLLGVKQPLINYVLSGRRRPRYLKLITSTPEIREYIDKVVESIASKHGRKSEELTITCDICNMIRSNTELLKTLIEKLGYSYDQVYIPYHE